MAGLAWHEQGVGLTKPARKTPAHLRLAAASVAVLLPWLIPWAGGPAPSVTPLLLAWAAAAIGWLVCARGPAGWPAPRWAAILAGGWLAAALLSAVLGLLQYAGLSAALAPWVSSAPAGEAFAQLRQRNQFATLTNIGLVALLWWALQWQGAAPGRGRRGLWLGLAAALLAAGNAASSSRTGLLQLLVLGLLLVGAGGWRHGALRPVLATALAVYAVAVLLLPLVSGYSLAEAGLLARLSPAAESCESRAVLWRNVLHLIALRPWTGWGWGELDYAHFITAYPGPRFCVLLDNAHNLPLQLAVELGVPAALLLCGGLGWLVVRARPWRETEPARQMAWAVLALIGLHSLVEYPLWYGPFQVAVAGCLLLLLPPALAHGRRRVWAPVLATLVLGAAAYAAWDYHRVSQIYLPPAQRAAAYRAHTLEKIRASWLFRDQVRFAEFTLTPLTPGNAAQLNAMAHELLHFSPEARVVEKLIESALLLGREDEAHFFMQRYRTAYPQDYQRWRDAGRASGVQDAMK